MIPPSQREAALLGMALGKPIAQREAWLEAVCGEDHSLGQRLHTVYPQLNQFIGTPAYIGPEQAELSGLDIDTRSDISSLGVLPHELLAGGTPFVPRGPLPTRTCGENVWINPTASSDSTVTPRTP